MGAHVLRLILADDDPAVRSGLRQLVRGSHGMVVVAEAGSAEEAFELAQTQPAEVALLDLEMPTAGGLALASWLRPRRPDLALLAVTAHDAEEDVRTSFAAGFLGFVSKLASPDEMREAIDTVAVGRRYVPADVSPPPETSRPLSNREREVVALTAFGHSAKDAAAIFGVSPKTVETHPMRAMQKLGLRSRHELVLYALGVGLLDPWRRRR